ncbi:MAG: branched-chain amino acid transaminase [Dehalococcoidia bacterium]|nr:Branched-chain-amino-acid aminotransferase [Chloroflexota bacterium]MBT9159301.1 Branched-chain-amino-acid aminotransferase [Chloroflexota bacterium]
MEKAEKIWLNGELIPWDEARVHVLTHALHYGTAVFEGVRCYESAKGAALFRPGDHMRRLLRSAKIYQMNIPYSLDELCTAAREIVKANRFRECYVRPIAFYGFGKMGVNPRNNPVHVSLIAWEWGTYLGAEGMEKGIRCKISSWLRIDSRMLPPQAKASANYANSVLAHLEAQECGYDEAILLNLAGQVCEGAGENLLIIRDGTLITPPLSAGALSGITMNSAIAIARDIGIPFVSRDILREELYLADEAFFTGTAAEITPIREVDGRVIGNGGRGELTARIQAKFFDIVRGKDERFYHWLDFI